MIVTTISQVKIQKRRQVQAFREENGLTSFLGVIWYVDEKNNVGKLKNDVLMT